MIHKFYNQLGQEVGEYDDVIGEYHTSRDARKGELFLRKHWFDNVYMESPTAIDKPILKTLLKIGCQWVNILVLGVKSPSCLVSFDTKWIKRNGKEINYDKITPEGKNITGYNVQIVFDLDKGLVGGHNQKTLN